VPKLAEMGVQPDNPCPMKHPVETPITNRDAVQPIRSAEFRVKLNDTIDALMDEGRKHGDTVAAHTITWLAHHLQRLTNEWSNEPDEQNGQDKRSSNLQAMLKKADERIAELEDQLQSERASRFGIIAELLESRMQLSLYQRWLWWIVSGVALFMILGTLGVFVVLRSHWSMR